MGGQLFICKDGGLFQSIHHLLDFAINVAISVDNVVYVVFLCHVIAKVPLLDLHVFSFSRWKWCLEKEIGKVNTHEPCA